MKVTIDGQVYEVDIKGGEITVDGKPFAVSAERSGNQVSVEVAGKKRQVELHGDSVVVDGKAYAVDAEGLSRRPAAAPPPPRRPQVAAPPLPVAPSPPPDVIAPEAAPVPEAAVPDAGTTVVRAPMPGKILRVLVSPDDSVPYGGVLVVLEAMKMENEIRATAAGVVKSVPVTVGSTVNAGDPLVMLEG